MTGRRREPGFDGRQPAAVTNALAILDVVAASEPGITAREVGAQVTIPRATVYRILNQLVAEEYLVRSPDLRGFGLGRRMRELGHNLVQHHAVAPDEKALRPFDPLDPLDPIGQPASGR